MHRTCLEKCPAQRKNLEIVSTCGSCEYYLAVKVLPGLVYNLRKVLLTLIAELLKKLLTESLLYHPL